MLFCLRGSIGKLALVRQDENGAIASSLVIVRAKANIEPRFLFSFLRSASAQQSALGLNNGSAQPNLSVQQLQQISLPLPPREVQTEIALILRYLDDRIALLRETSATLEAIAQALFKSWFVDFDPVRAKQKGLAPEGMDEATAALFPECFAESGSGLLPKGWTEGSILDTATLLSGGTPKTDRPEYWGGQIAWASAKDVSQSRDSVLVRTERTITAQGLSESATRMIPALATVVVARGATTGRMVLLGKPMAMNQTCYALTSKVRAPAALYCLLRREMDALVNAAHGSVFDTITTGTFAQSKVVQPDPRLLERFEEIAGPLFEQLTIATNSALTLATLRDTLLPRLISGQLRLPQAESELETT